MKENRHPNVIVILTDQQRWDTVGLHGNPNGLTPNLDRLATAGTHVFNSFTCQAVCGPSRACLQTGLYATQTGCYRNGIPLRKDANTIAHQFRSAGYLTGYIGKWHLAAQEPVPEEQRGGYEYWLAANVLEFVSDSYSTKVFDNDNQSVFLPGYRVDALTDAGIRFIALNRDKPFFLFVSYLEPHHQNHLDDFPPPDGYREKYTGRWMPPDLAALGGSAHRQLAGYYGMVKRIDEALGRLMDALKSLGLVDNTIVLFTSDHGCHFKTRNSEYKRSCHDSSIRVPTAVWGPGFDQGGQLREMVSIVDIAPTLLDAAGLPIPGHMIGQSFLQLLRGRSEEWRKEIFVQISESQVGRAIRTERWKYCVIAPDKSGWDDAGSDIYVEDSLYDLETDPYELENLIGLESHKGVCAELRDRLRELMLEAGEAVPEIMPAPSRSSGERGLTPSEGPVRLGHMNSMEGDV